MDVEDVLGDSIGLFGDEQQVDDQIVYGPLVLTTAPKEGKANTLLADHLFSPSLLLAERLERGLIQVAGKSVVELGAGCALPSLLSTTLSDPPSLVVITDYPDQTILGNLTQNVERNRDHMSPTCRTHCLGYEWGQDVAGLLQLASTMGTEHPSGYDIVILSDLLHFDGSHDVLLSSLVSLLRKLPTSRAYVAAGKYTPTHVCQHFISAAEKAGIVWEQGEDDPVWRGTLSVRGGGLTKEQLGSDIVKCIFRRLRATPI
ncbi:hypothetical protein NM688_g2250 [Phlebia brevispora]|uniref:Uncharacterized protein n=1 Tax=Phlebia brevispora TaxID=194682 RepID=A0ACC1T9E8_9APHY|nr:hypothetical protein NM688_g2250 [Phlebia brevispora]